MISSNKTGINAVVIKECSFCGKEISGDCEALSTVMCPHCKHEVFVRGKLDNYTIIRLVGCGGMGGVFEAIDEALQRNVAIKVILKEKVASDPALIDALKKEAQAAAKLNHSSIVQVYAFGEYLGQPYIVMELVQTDSLDKMIERKEQDSATIFRFCSQLAGGLKQATEHGLVHGDVKPENILINDMHDAKLADFGIAALVANSNNSESKNEVWGTPYYIAPETLRKQPTDFHSDMYSLGATIYHALCGQPPFEGENAIEVMKARLTNPPISIKTYRPDLKPALVDVVMRMLDPDPLKRFASYDDLIKALESAEKKSNPKKLIIKSAQMKGNGLRIADTDSLERVSPSIDPIMQAAHQRKITMMIVGGVVLLLGLISGLILLVVKSTSTVETTAPGAPSTMPIASSVTPESALQQEGLAYTQTLNNAITKLKEQAKRLQENNQRLQTAIPMIMRETSAACSTEQSDKIALSFPTVAPLVLDKPLPEVPALIKEETDIEEEAGLTEATETQLPQIIQQAHAIFIANEQLKVTLAWTNQLIVILETQVGLVAQGTMDSDALKSASAQVDTLLKAFEAHPFTKQANATYADTYKTVKQFKTFSDRAREVLLAENAARMEKEKQMELAEKERLIAERQQVEETREMSSVAVARANIQQAFLNMDFDKALEAYTKTTKTLKSTKAKELALYPIEQINYMKKLKAFLIKSINDGYGKSWGISAATETSITMNRKENPWSLLTTEVQGQAIIFTMIKSYVAESDNGPRLSISERIDLSIAGVLFCKSYITKGNPTVAATIQVLQEYAVEKASSSEKKIAFILTGVEQE